MKVLSVTVPCYNSESYMNHCIETLVSGGEDIEVIIVNDGSTKDNTLQIARQWETKVPSIVKVIDKENGGHGSAVNAGLEAASGLYFKVVDSDDWVDETVLQKIISILKEFEENKNPVDLFLSDFMYDKQGAKKKKVMRYKGIVPERQVVSWDQCTRFHIGNYILMHAIIYRTQILRDCKMKLPEHTFYVDNIFAYNPIPYVKKIYYLDQTFYHYFVGRDDQSVNEKVMIKRIDQQLRVNYLMIDEYAKDRELLKEQKRVKQYMFEYLEVIMGVSSIMCNLSKDKENYEKKMKLWSYLKDKSPSTYRKMNLRIIGHNLNSRSAIKRGICFIVYKTAQKVFGFN